MDDSTLIDRYGGAAKLAELLGFDKGGIQRVHNWRARGIPPAVKLERLDLFGPEAVRQLIADTPPTPPGSVEPPAPSVGEHAAACSWPADKSDRRDKPRRADPWRPNRVERGTGRRETEKPQG